MNAKNDNKDINNYELNIEYMILGSQLTLYNFFLQRSSIRQAWTTAD